MNYKIQIPEPCHEDWEQMTPQSQGRFCGSCSKTVVDFTGMTPQEIKNYFLQHQGQRICGRFETQQLDDITIQVPYRVLQQKYSFQRMFALAFFIAMGAGLLSCTNKDGQVKDVQKVEVVERPVDVKLGDMEIPPQVEIGKVDNSQIIPPPPLPPSIREPRPGEVIKTFTTLGAFKVEKPDNSNKKGKEDVIVNSTTGSTTGLVASIPLPPPLSPKINEIKSTFQLPVQDTTNTQTHVIGATAVGIKIEIAED